MMKVKKKIMSIWFNREKKSSGSNVKNVVTWTTLTAPSAMTDQYWSTHQQLTKAQSIWQNEASVTISSLRIDGRGVCESKHRRSLCDWHELIVLRVLLASSESHWFRLSAMFTVCKWDHTDASWCGWMCFTLGPAVVMSERWNVLAPGWIVIPEQIHGAVGTDSNTEECAHLLQKQHFCSCWVCKESQF